MVETNSMLSPVVPSRPAVGEAARRREEIIRRLTEEVLHALT